MNKFFIVLILFSLAVNCLALGHMSIHEKSEVEKDTLTDYQILTDSIIKYPFGYACSISAMPPKGRKAIDNLVRNKEYQTIKLVLDGLNNEGKIYAIEALLKLNLNKDIELTDDDKSKIKSIIEKNVIIMNCEGCLYSQISSIELFNEKDFKKLLNRNKIDISIVSK